MLKPKELLYFYRILNWENKISGARPIGYLFLGYLIAGNFDFLLIFLNTFAIFGVLIFCYGMNDYFDWKIQKEKNFLSYKLKKKEITDKEALKYYFLPLAFCIPFFIIASKISLIIFLMGFLFILFYSVRPIRFKKIKFLGFIFPPLAVSLLFLEGYSILGIFNIDVYLLAILIFIFQCYLEAFHVLEDSKIKEETKKIKDVKRIEKIAKTLPFFSFILSIFFSLINPFFLITSFFSIIRFFSLRKVNIKKEINRIRRNIFLPQWSLYEFLFYGILGLLHLF